MWYCGILKIYNRFSDVFGVKISQIFLHFLLDKMFWLLLTVCLAVVSADVRFPLCGKERIQPQRKFNVTAFLGHWHAVADYNVQGKAFSHYVEPMDMHATFRREKDGSLSFKTGRAMHI